MRLVSWGLLQAPRGLGYEVVQLGLRDPGETGNADPDVVDEVIRRMLGALRDREGVVDLASLDGDFE